MDESTFDYCVVGAGAAGCVVANRLSANRDATVLLLEAAQDRWAVSLLGTLGLASFAIAYRLWQEIQRDIAALSGAIDPAADDPDRQRSSASQ